MPKYHWVGGTTNLGRFGTVKHGDVLNLTDKEQESIASNGPNGGLDTRFRPFKEGAKIDAAGLDLPEGYERLTKDGQAVARKEAEDARKRFEALNNAVSPQSGIASAGGATGQPKSAEALAADEQARLQRLQAANSETDTENYREMTKAELGDVIDEIRREGTPVELGAKPTRKAMLRAVLTAKGLSTDDLGEDDSGD